MNNSKHYVWKVLVHGHAKRYHYFVIGGEEIMSIRIKPMPWRKIVGLTRMRSVPEWAEWTQYERAAFIQKHLAGCYYE